MCVLLQESQDWWLDTDFGFARYSASIVQDVFLSLSAGTWTVLHGIKGPDHFHMSCVQQAELEPRWKWMLHINNSNCSDDWVAVLKSSY